MLSYYVFGVFIIIKHEFSTVQYSVTQCVYFLQIGKVLLCQES